MDTLDGTSWDVVITGTGIQEALLALALSRSNKKILHLDSNDYYGRREAALSISELEAWVEKHKGPSSADTFCNASATRPGSSSDGQTRLSSPRVYSLSLSPCLLYTRSTLLPALVSSKAHEQLEFLAVGSWFVYQSSPSPLDPGQLVRVPNSREDIFSNPALTLRVKGALVKFLRFVGVYQHEEFLEVWDDWKTKSFPDFLVNKFKIAKDFHGPLLALSMSPTPDAKVTTDFALASIHRHLTSMGVFGGGFSAILPKYGGLSEVVQVACRAAAVGGAVYVLNRAVAQVIEPKEEGSDIHIELGGGNKVTTRHLVGAKDQLPMKIFTGTEITVCTRSISIIGSRLSTLFPPGVEGSPPPSAAVVVYPTGAVLPKDDSGTNTHPIHVLIHSSDTGECPAGQCVVYAMTQKPISHASALLEAAVHMLLVSMREDPAPSLLWTTTYEIHSQSDGPGVESASSCGNILRFTESQDAPVMDDRMLQTVKDVWQSITGGRVEEFMRFVDRRLAADDGLDTEDSPSSGDEFS